MFLFKPTYLILEVTILVGTLSYHRSSNSFHDMARTEKYIGLKKAMVRFRRSNLGPVEYI